MTVPTPPAQGDAPTDASQTDASQTDAARTDAAEAHVAPRVVLFRANSIGTDSRAKKLSVTLARLGYDVVVLSAEEPGASTRERRLGAPEHEVRVVPVPISRTNRDLRLHTLVARRRRQFRFIDWTPTDEYVTQVAEAKTRVTGYKRTAVRTEAPSKALWAARWAAGMALLRARRLRWRAQWAVNVVYRTGWQRWDAWRVRSELLATTRGTLPEVEDYATSFSGVLDAQAPDIIHAHHPLVLGTAVRAARRRRAAGRRALVVYDAREDFLGLPKEEQGNWRRHSTLVREEARYIREADAVMTVCEPISHRLQERYDLPVPPAVVLNVPVDDPRVRPGSPALAGEPTVRDVVGLAPDVPLLVYAGAVSRARGLDVLVAALPKLPGVHAVVVATPFPHPLQAPLAEQAASLGVADRLHFAPPVDQDRLLHYLSGATLGAMVQRADSANTAAALPNKMFEYLHAGLPMFTSDAPLIAAFVTEHGLGTVFRDGDPDDLARAVREVLADPPDPCGQAWEQLRRRYSWQGQEAMVRQVYAALVPPPSPAGIDDPAFGSLSVTDPPS